MNERHNNLTRRNFLTSAAAAAAMTALVGCAPHHEDAGEDGELASTSQGWLGAPPEIDESQIASTLNTSLLIIGAGNGGLCAAATAADEGIDFMLCEKNASVQTTRVCIGAVGTRSQQELGISIDSQRLLNEATRYASGACNQRVWKVWIDESAEMLDWMDAIMGERAIVDPSHDGVATGGTNYYVPSIMHLYGEQDRNERLAEYLSEHDHNIYFGYDLKKILLNDDKSVAGALFETDEGIVRINAEDIILATGGYPANRAMIEDIAPLVARCVTAAGYSPSNDGYGLRAAMWAGAQKDLYSAPMIFDRGAVRPGVDAGYDSEGQSAGFRSDYGNAGQFNLGSQPFMKVNRFGRRFTNESAPYDFICHAAAHQPGGVWCQVIDANAKEDIMRFETIGCSMITQMVAMMPDELDVLYADDIERGFMARAESIEELADKLGFEGENKQAFLDEVDRYNSFYDAQSDSDFGKEAYRLSSLRKAPFYGTWFGGTLLTTLDGIIIDEDMRAISENGSPIQGLFAIGDCSGSMFNGNYPEYIPGCAVGRTMTFGRHAVKYIAAHR